MSTWIICWRRADGTLTIAAIVALFLGVALLAGDAVAQQKAKITKEQLAGTWTWVSSKLERPDGSLVDGFGPNPKGVYMFDAKGHFAFVLQRADLPKIASNNRLTATPEENQAITRGTLSVYGTYSVDEAEGSVTQHIEGSSFPNWNGTQQKRLMTITGDELKITVPVASAGLKSHNVLKRAK